MDTKLREALEALPPDEGLAQPMGALQGDIYGYVIASRCMTFFMRSPGQWPWSKPVCWTTFDRLVQSRAELIDTARRFLEYMESARGSGHEGFDPFRYVWEVRSMGCMSLREPPWFLHADFEPVLVWAPPTAAESATHLGPVPPSLRDLEQQA